MRKRNVGLTRVHVLAVAFGADIAVTFFVLDALASGLETRRVLR